MNGCLGRFGGLIYVRCFSHLGASIDGCIEISFGPEFVSFLLFLETNWW